MTFTPVPTHTPPEALEERIDGRRLWWAGPMTILTVVIANCIVRVIGISVLKISPRFLPLMWGPVIAASLIGTIGAVIIFAVVARVACQPIRTFQLIAGIALILSFLPDMGLLLINLPGTNAPAVAILMTMHIVTTILSSGLMAWSTRYSQSVG